MPALAYRDRGFPTPPASGLDFELFDSAECRLAMSTITSRAI
jgi:hypothetical protein